MVPRVGDVYLAIVHRKPARLIEIPDVTSGTSWGTAEWSMPSFEWHGVTLPVSSWSSEGVPTIDWDHVAWHTLSPSFKQLNLELAKQMRNEFDKQKSSDGIVLGKNAETGVIILDEDPEWVWIREDASGSYIELRLDKEYGYVLNVIQSEFEQYDFELGGIENAITIQQIN